MSSIRDIFDTFSKSKATLLTHENAPALAKWVEEQSRIVGLKQVPLVIHLEHPLPMGHGGFVPINGKWHPMVALTEGAMQRIFGKPDLAREVPPKLKAVIGHEMSHATEGLVRLQTGHLPLFAIPILSLIGYELYDQAQKRHAKDPSKDMEQHLNEVTEAERKNLSADDKVRHDRESAWLSMSKRVAVIGGGLVAGGMVCRHMACASEFAADRMGVLAAGDAQAAIDVLTDFRRAISEYNGPKLKEWAKEMQKRSFKEKCGELYEIAKMMVAEMTYSAHPSYAERFAAIKKFGAERGMPSTIPGI